LTALPLAASAQSVSMKVVEKAILKEDWKQVAKLLESVSDDVKGSPDPVLRLIKGHASLALNRNNESLCLLLSVTVPDDLEKCRDWAKRFAARNSRDAIAHYFQGDAAARLHKWTQAITHYGYALELNDAHGLVYNARGVARASDGDYRGARVDFTDAVAYSDGRLADAHANIGALCLQRKDGAKGGLRAFDVALKLSPDFALALHGRGCVKTSLGCVDEAKVDLRKAEELCHCGDMAALFLANAIRYRAFWSGSDPNELLAMVGSGDDAGTTFDARMSAQSRHSKPTDGPSPSFQAWEQRWQQYADKGHGKAWQFGQNAYNRQAQAFHGLTPDEKNLATGQMRIGLTNNSTLASNEARHRTEYTNHNAPGGGADVFNKITLPSTAALLAFAPEPTATKIGAAALTGTIGHNTIWQGVHNANANDLNSRLGRPGNLVGAMSRADMQSEMRAFMDSKARSLSSGGPSGGIGGSNGPMTPARMQTEMRAFMNSQAQSHTPSFGGLGQDAGRGTGGAQADFTGVKRDNGCWPFVGYFALAYCDQCDDVPVDDILKTLAERGDGQVRPDQQ